MSACEHFDPLIADRVAGCIDPAENDRLELHLRICERCRTELAAYEKAVSLARLPAVSAAERQALRPLPSLVRGEVDRAPLMNAFGRLLALAAVAAAIVVVLANRLILPGAERSAAARAAVVAAWQEPDLEALDAKVLADHAELAIASDEPLSRAETLADAAYAKALGGTE